ATLSANVDFRETDLVTGIQPGFDVIVANLPYVGENERASLAPDVRDHEPSLALFSGPDGLNAIRRLVVDARKLVGAGGLLALEIGAGQGQGVRELMEQAGWSKVAVQADLAGHPRVVVGEAAS
ncbi:MAG TPA: peptide chain release factor N(5)-glutamine methyltransferase, partial [Myxococcota bacterium]|nr:peptide chain release factor N(5)-glutamine methyltransferase [Myxococcota bacterium]